MTIKTKKFRIIVGAVAMALACGVGAGTITANADTPALQDYASFAMLDGASVRVKKDEKAIRFTTRISKSDLHSAVGIEANDDAVAINAKLATAKIVTMITPTRYLDAENLTDFDATTDIAKQLVEIRANKYVKNAENIYETDSNVNKDDYYYFNACLYNVEEWNISRKFSAKSYLSIETSVDGEIEETIVDYTDFDYEKNSRDIWDIANQAKQNSTLYPDTEETDEPYDYLAALSKSYTVTVDGAENTLKRGESVLWHDELITGEVAGQKYFAEYQTQDGSAYEVAPLSADIELTSTYDEISYLYTDGTYTVTGAADMLANPRNTEGLLVIPDTYNDGTNNSANVTAIAEKAFDHDTNAKNAALKKAVLSDNITSIGSYAFRNCKNLTYVKMRGVSELSSGQFFNCNSIKTVIVGRRFIPAGASFMINQKITEENKSQFMTADVYYDSTYNNGQAYINLRGVYNTESHWTDTSLQRNNIFSTKLYTYSATKVMGGWYYDENGEIALWDGHYYTASTGGALSAQTAPAHTYENYECTVCGVKTINYTYDSSLGGYVLSSYADAATEYTIPESYDDGVNSSHPIVAIGARAFQGNTTITKVIMPRTVTSIGQLAFEGCTALTYVQMEGVHTMSSTEAFNNCSALRTIIVGKMFESTGRNFWSNKTTAGQLDLYVSDYVNGIRTNINLQPCFEGSSYNTGHSRNDLFSLKVYFLSADTATAGGWTYVDGIATANSVDSYYQITGANTFIDPAEIVVAG